MSLRDEYFSTDGQKPVCACGHRHYDHEGPENNQESFDHLPIMLYGKCRVPECSCVEFVTPITA